MNTPFIPSRWIWLSCLQKSLRRGHTEMALRAAHHLYTTEPANLLRRLKLIAIEDIALGNPTLVHRVLLTQQPDWTTMADLITGLSTSIKDRSACDLSEALNAGFAHPLLHEASQRIRLRATSSTDPLIQELATLGWQATKEPLALLLPLVAEQGAANEWSPDTFTNLPLIHGLPSETFDKYTREGCTAYRRALKQHPTLNVQLIAHHPTGRVNDLLGYAMFAVESARLDRRLTYPGSADVLRLGQEADICRFGIPPQQVPDVMAVVAEALPAIHQARCDVLRFTSDNPHLSKVKQLHINFRHTLK